MDRRTVPTYAQLTPWLSRLARALAWLALAVGLCIGMGWTALHVWIVPRIGDFRPALEQLATRTMGMPVQVGELRAESTGWVPSFELREVRLLDAHKQPVLTLPRVVVAISVRSVLRLGLDQLVLDRPQLDVRHTASGQWLVAGLALGQAGSDNRDAADWLFGQREVVVRGGTVRWISERAAGTADAPALTLTDVDLVLRNALRQHEMRLDATPPAEWGERFVLAGRFQRGLLSTHPGHFEDWHGQAYAYFPRADVAQLRQHLRLGVDLLSGHGRLRLWSDIQRGEWAGGAADLDLKQVRMRLDKGLDVLGFATLSGRLSGQQGAKGWSLATQHLAFQSEQGLRWPGGDVSLQHTLATDRQAETTQLQGERLDLPALREVALRLPLPEIWHQRLRERTLGGQVKSLQLRWQGPADAPQQIQGQIEAEHLRVQAQANASEAWPGIQGARLSAQFQPDGGKVQLAIEHGGWVAWPGLFDEDTVPVRLLQVEGRWQRQGQGWAVPQWKVQLSNDDLQGQAQGQWQSLPHSALGLLDLQAQVSQARAHRVHRYLPMQLPAEVRRYVRESVLQGQIRQLQVRIKGDLDKLPMPNARDGEFRFAAQLKDVDMAYVPPSLLPPGSPAWPTLRKLQGDLVFERQGMRLHNASALMGEGKTPLQVSRLRAEIPDLEHDAKLDLSAELKGPAVQVLRSVQQSPLDALLSGALTQAQASGNLQGKLRLLIPLMHSQDSQVQGSVTLAGNDVQLSPHVPLLEKAQGTVHFTESGFSLQGVQVRLLGGNSRLEGGLRSAAVPAGEPPLLIRAQGQISAEGLRAAHTLAPLDALARQAKGQTPYTASLGWRGEHPELSVRSSLEGLELDLPAPLAKRASQALPLNISTRVLDPAGRSPRDELQIELGQVASATYVRDLSGPSPRVLRGTLALGQGSSAPPLPEQGVSALARVDELSVDRWQALWPSGSSSPSGHEAGTAWLAYLPNRLGLQAGTLTAEGRTLHELVAGVTREGLTWRANLDARELSGHAQYTLPSQEQGARLFARLARLDLPPSAVSDVESMLEAPPATMPALDIQIDNLVLRGKQLGKVEIEAVNQELRTPRTGQAQTREWLLNTFNLSVPEASLRANGRWAAATDNRPRRTEMHFRLDIQDAGALLTRLGTPGALRAGAGSLDGQVSWHGSPLALHPPSLQGQFHVKMGRGQFLKADPGAAKLLGVLSLQALPRRLLLDFRDVFYEGFAFDSVRGDVQIHNGIASTRNLQIQGIGAVVRMEGSADIARETQQLRVLILPQLDAGGASVLAALTVNPVVGLTSFLAQWLLTAPLSKA
ncbi:MAG: TIGR02099 family protein, partial [Betaproteobacteria bacterium]|nr:TIGR02099 family protein [Betaproteobacteria bacterium]